MIITVTMIKMTEGSLESTTAEIVTPVIHFSSVEITNKEVASSIIIEIENRNH